METSRKLLRCLNGAASTTGLGLIKLKQSYTIRDSTYNSNDDDDEDAKEDGHLSKRLSQSIIVSACTDGVYGVCVGGASIGRRHLMQAHYKACLYAGVGVSGYDQDVSGDDEDLTYEMEAFESGQEAADHLILSRYM